MGRVRVKRQQKEPAFPWVRAALIFIVAAGIYSNTFQHGYVLDDISVISENRYVTSGWSGLTDIWTNSYRDGYWNDSGTLYRPLTQTIFAFQWALAPNSPGFAHIFNILIYGILCVILFRLIKALTQQEDIAFFSALIFSVITVHTEVVANIKSLDEILSLLFGLGAWWWILRYLGQKESKALIIGGLLFTAGMFTKEGLIAFLAVIPLSLWFFRNLGPREWIKPSLPLLIGSGIYLLTRASVLGGITASLTPSSIDNPMVDYGFLERWLTGFKLLALYIEKLLIPHPLAYEYAFNTISAGGLTDAYTWAGIILMFGIAALILKGWQKQRTTAFLAAYFLITMVLYSNTIILIGAMFAERFLFFASIAFAWTLALLIQRLSKRPLQYASLVLILLIYGGLSYARNPVWESSYSLYAADVAVLSSSCKAHYNFGLETMKEKALKAPNQAEKNRLLNEAKRSFERALEIKPGYNLAKGQIALVYYRLGQHEEAIRRYNEVLSKNPNDDSGWNNLAGSYVAQQQYDEALRCYEEAIQLNPYYTDALGNAGAVNGMLGRHQAAIEYLKRAAALSPNNASYQQYLGLSYQAIGQNDVAQSYFQRAQQLKK